jgi:hypothetical protein
MASLQMMSPFDEPSREERMDDGEQEDCDGDAIERIRLETRRQRFEQAGRSRRIRRQRKRKCGAGWMHRR